MIRFSLFIAFLVLFSGCSTLQVVEDYNSGTDFSRLRTYAWLEDGEKPGDDVRVNNSLVVESVRSSVENELASKGFSKADPQQADFIVTWFGGIEEKMKTENIDHFYRRYGYGALYRDPNFNAKPTIASVKEYEEGHLIIDIIDPETQKLIWRGGGKDKVVKGRSEEQVQRKLREAIKKIMADFPPK